jgi:hypothetical protein
MRTTAFKKVQRASTYESQSQGIPQDKRETPREFPETMRRLDASQAGLARLKPALGMDIAGEAAMPASPPGPSKDQLHAAWRGPEELPKQMTHFRNGQGKQGSGIPSRIKSRQSLCGKQRRGQGDSLGTDPGQEGMRQPHQGDMAIPADEAAHLVVVQAQIFARFKVFLNGLITNDKFCLSRTARLQLSWWRLPRNARQTISAGVESPVTGNTEEYLPQQEAHEETTMDRSASLRGTA